VSATAVLVLYPTWAIAVLLGASALRVGSRRDRGLVALCFLVALWVTALVLFVHPGSRALAERVIPSGMLLAGGFVHAGQDLLGARGKRARGLAYGFGAIVAIVGAIWPRGLYTAGLAAPGPLFWPIAAASVVGVVWTMTWMIRAAARARHARRARLVALTLGNACGCIAGGGAVVMHFAGVIDDIIVTAPCLLAAVCLIGWAVLAGEHGRNRRLLAQALVTALITAICAALGLAVFLAILPALVPAAGPGWLLLVLFLATLPLDATRALLVDRLARAIFRQPSGVRDLADEIERSETRADQAERLAAIGAITSAVAHEIRNPLGVIAAQAKLLERAGASPDSVAALRAQVARAKVFVDDLLRYGQPRPLAIDEVLLPELIRSALAVSSEHLGSAEVSIAVPEIIVDGDRAALGDVLIVLLSNAGISLAGRGRIDIRAQQTGAWVELSVTDDGGGVPPELEDRLFEPFATGRGRDHRHPGTGLGLAIAARWLERHQGSLRHERPTEGGARFVLRLPARA
jgi:signal transduction histidine kinase